MSELKPGGVAWIKKDGTPIMLSDMEPSHLQNCINMLIRRAHSISREAFEDDLSALANAYSYTNGEHARDAIDEQIQLLQPTDPQLLLDASPTFVALTMELNSRKGRKDAA